MLNSTGQGYMTNVEQGITEDGNWYLRFYLVDGSGNEWLCKTLNEEHKRLNLQSGNYVGILKSTWRTWKDTGIPYIEVYDMMKGEDENYQRQLQALKNVNKALTE
jgi:hypothetical protein